MSLAESMEAAAADVLAGMLPPEPPTPVAAPTDTPEEEVPAVEAEAPDGEPEAEEADPEESAEKTEAVPEGYAKVGVIADKLATEFVIRDAEGEIAVPDVVIEYKANGKVRKDRLDQVVKLAQFGVYNEERERKVAQTETQLRSLTDERATLAKTLEEREAQLERILTDDNFFEAVREAYQRENSPEQRATRAEQEAQQLREAQKYAPMFAEQEQFNDREVVPALNMIAQALPDVTVEELESKLAMVVLANAEMAPTGDRFIPSSRFDAIRQYIVEDLAMWAQMQQARRSEGRQPVQAAPSELDKARIEAQKAKRQVGQATKPMSSANGKVAPKKAKAPANVDEAQAQAENEVLASLGLR